MKMREFKIGLAAIVGDPCVGSRPFVCDGSPLDCRVMLVGINPASDTAENFWNFWSGDSGFNRREWLDAYVKSRESRGLPPFTNSRKVIERIIRAVRPASCLEANLYAKESPRSGDLRSGEKSVAVLEFLLDKIDRARLVVVFGGNKQERETVCRIMSGGRGCRDSDRAFFGAFGGGEVCSFGGDVYALFVRHYIYWSHANADKFGEWLRGEVEV